MAAAQAAAQQRLASIPMYRPEQMRNISLLTEQEKVKYEKGLASLWLMHDQAPRGSPESIEAKKKIMEFGKMLSMKMHERKNQAIQSRQAPLQLQQPPQQQQLQQPGGANAGASAQTLAANNSDGVGPVPGGAGPSAGVSGTVGGANTVAANAANGAAKPGGQQQPRLPPHIADHLNQISFQAPPSLAEQDKTRWIHDLKIKYTRALVSMESARQNVARLDQTVKERQEKGSPLSPEEQKNVMEKKTQWQKQYSEAQNFLNQARKQYVVAQPRPQQNGAAQSSGAGENTGAASAPGNAMQTSTATVNAAIEVAKNQQLAAGRMPGTNGLPGQQPPQQVQQTQAPTSLAQAQPSSVTAPSTQPAAPQSSQSQPQAPIKIEPGTQPTSLPAPLNTALASTAAAGLPSAGTPTQNSARLHTPQTATPTAGAPRPLSHTAALHLANQRSASLPGAAGSAPGSASQQPTVSGVIGGAQGGHLHAHPAQLGTTQLPSKLPIPKVLPEKATQVPAPAATMGGLGNGRPSYSGGSGIPGGVMGQPVVAKTPSYQLEGEGERILNKKKLDELVKQVCGGTAEGQEGDLLTPEVEEVSLPSLLPGYLIATVGETSKADASRSRSSTWLTRLLTMSCMRRAEILRSAAPRCLRSATSSSYWSGPTISASRVTRATSCESYVRSSQAPSGSPR